MSTLLNNFREKTQRAGLVRLPQIPPPPKPVCISPRNFPLSDNLVTPRLALDSHIQRSRRVVSPPRRARGEGDGTRDRARLTPNFISTILSPAQGVAKWGRTSTRTTSTRPRDISNATGGTMTTRTGEPATKRESYTQYIQGRAAAVRSTPKRVSTALFPRFRFARAPNATYPLSAIHARARESRGGPLTSPHHIEQQEMPDIDSVDRENPLAVTEYVNDIFSYWFRVEVRVRFCPDSARFPLARLAPRRLEGPAVAAKF